MSAVLANASERVQKGRAVLFTLLAVVASVGVARGEQYLPLFVGNWWEYRGSYLGEHEVQRVESSTWIDGIQVFCVVFRQSSHNEGLTQYWSTNSDGDVTLWAWVEPDGYGILYQPPVVFVDSPLSLNRSWVQKVGVYTLPDTTLLGYFDFDMEVYEELDLSVPAGRFHVYGVGFSAHIPAHLSLLVNRDITGLWDPDPGRNETSKWWTEDVGQVQYTTSDMYQLVAFQEPTPVSSLSWGRVKALFQR